MLWNAILQSCFDFDLNDLARADFDLICKSILTYDLWFWFKSKF